MNSFLPFSTTLRQLSKASTLSYVAGTVNSPLVFRKPHFSPTFTGASPQLKPCTSPPLIIPPISWKAGAVVASRSPLVLMKAPFFVEGSSTAAYPLVLKRKQCL